MDAFRRAHESRDAEAILRLVYWQGTDGETRKSVEEGVAADFGLPIKSIRMESLAADDKLEYTRSGVTYRPNLAPVGKMRVEFEPPAGGQLTAQSSGYLIGVKDGAYFIATAAPVSR